MNLDLDKSTWKRVALRDVIRHVTDRVDPETSGLERFLAGEHIPSESLGIRKWGVIGKDPIGPMFYKRFRPGHVLYVSRRAYLRKVAVPDFTGICGEKTFVLETLDPELLSQDFLPFVMSAERFHAYAVAMSRGSVNPYINWTDIAAYEFDLPPLDEQKRIAELLWSLETDQGSNHTLDLRLRATRRAWLHSLFTHASAGSRLVELDSLIDPERPVCYGVLMPGPEFEGGRLIVDVKDYPDGRVRLESVRRCNLEIESQFKRSRLRSRDILLSIRGTIGRVAVVPDELDGHNISRDSARISGDPEKVLPDFLRLVLESPDVQDEIRRTTTGLAVKGINIGRIRTLMVPDWSLDQQGVACVQIQVIEDAIARVAQTSTALDGLRRSLSTELFGGAA